MTGDLFHTIVRDSILGSFRINEFGDPVSIVPTAATQSYLFAVVRGGTFKALKDLRPKQELVDAAKGKG